MEACLNCCSDRKSNNKVEEIFFQAIDDYKLYNNKRAKPNMDAFTILLDSWMSRKTQNKDNDDSKIVDY